MFSDENYLRIKMFTPTTASSSAPPPSNTGVLADRMAFLECYRE